MKSNNFDFLRLCAATAVIWSHVPPLLGVPGNRGDFGAASVFTFFAISGYLVTESWERDPNAVRFAFRRILRIVPGLAVVVLLSALVMGPLVSDLPVATYFSSPMVATYCRDILLFPIHFGLPGVFTKNHYAGIVNGSLWTLPIEALMYFGLMVLGSLRAWQMPVISFGLGAASVLAIHAYDHWWTLPWGNIPIILTVNAAELVDCTVCFLTGAIISTAKGKIPLISWSWVPVLALCYVAHPHPIESLVLLFGVPYAAISFALKPLPVVKSAGRFGDFSYGIYIYAFPIMQLVAMWWPKISETQYFVVAVALSVIAGAASWWAVESQSLKLKRLLSLPLWNRAQTTVFRYLP